MRKTPHILLLLVLSFTACDKGDEYEDFGFLYTDESVNQRFTESMEWNAVNPYITVNTDSSEYSVHIMSDSHVGETINLERFLGEAVANESVASLMAGDLTTGHAEDYEMFESALPGRDSILTFQMAGNHDLFFGGWEEFLKRFGSSTYYFSVSTPDTSDLYICLDTGSGTLGRKQLEWFTDILEKQRPDYRYCFVVTHNNLFRIRKTFSTNPLVEELYVLLDLFARHNVNMVITGHDHVRNVVSLGNTTLITLDALKYGNTNPGFLVLTVSGDKPGYEFIDLY